MGGGAELDALGKSWRRRRRRRRPRVRVLPGTNLVLTYFIMGLI